MIDLSALKHQRFAVLGLARSGLAACDAMRAAGVPFVAYDDQPAARDKLVEPAREWCDLTDESAWHNITALLLSPGVPTTYPQPHRCVEIARQKNIPLTSDIDVLYQACPQAKYVGITGTNGKSTTTALIGHILTHHDARTQVGGNIGTAVLQLNRPSADAAFVLEMSSYQLDISNHVRFDVAVFLSLTSDHLDRHGNMDNYYAAKKRIMRADQKRRLTAVICSDDAWGQRLLHETKTDGIECIEVSTQRRVTGGIYVRDAMLIDDRHNKQHVMIDLSTLAQLRGVHNWQNAVASYAACVAMNVPTEQIVAALQTFIGLPHRMEIVGQWRHIHFVNDSKATNADSTAKALASYPRIYLIAGGKAKPGGIESLMNALYQPVVKTYLIGHAAAEFATTLAAHHHPFQHSQTLAQALADAVIDVMRDPQPATILLSPACASFDQFKSYEHRGDEFRALVQTWIKKQQLS